MDASELSQLTVPNLTPRRSTSRQWVEIPTDLVKNLKAVFNEQFKGETRFGEFVFEGRIFPEEIIMRIGYLEKGRLRQINFEASVDLPVDSNLLSSQTTTPTDESLGLRAESMSLQKIYACVDILGSVLEEYFELDDEDQIDIPERWQPFQFEGQTIYLQRSTVNSKLEQEADRILGLSENRLYHEPPPSEDALTNAEINPELALEIQKAIRSGEWPIANKDESESTPESVN